MTRIRLRPNRVRLRRREFPAALTALAALAFGSAGPASADAHGDACFHHPGCGHQVHTLYATPGLAPGTGPGSTASPEVGCDHDPRRTADFQILNRWTATASLPFPPIVDRPGQPIDLTWGFARDGSTIESTRDTEPTGPSGLIAFFDELFDPDATGGDDLTQRAWFATIESAFERIDELSGVNYAYEPNDDGSDIPGVRGRLGVRADVRLAGHSIDGVGGSGGPGTPDVVAYNYLPDAADMVFDTDNASLLGNPIQDFLVLRNVVMHEAGHGLGLAHVESSDASFLMEPRISLSFDGPQFDDLLALHRNYGDARESGLGNDSPARADFLATLGFDDLGATVSLGTDASDLTRVEPDQTDFVSIDGDNDTDVFRFTVEPGLTQAQLDFFLTPQGPTYLEGPQNDTDPDTPDIEQTLLETHALSDLVLEVLDASGQVHAFADATVAGEAERLLGLTLTPGDWFVRVTGKTDHVQMYRLDLTLIPEPGVALGLGVLGLLARRRRYPPTTP